MKYYFVLLSIFIFPNFSFSKNICQPPIIKSQKELEEKLSICNNGDKLLLNFDVKLKSEELIVKLCNLEHTIITKEQNSIIHKRGSALTIICIYQNSVNGFCNKVAPPYL